MSSIYPERNRSAWIIAHRPPRAAVDPFTPHGYFLEEELSASQRLVSSAVILLTNKECPWRCLMCDLWKHTLTRSVSLGAIPRQIDYVLSRLPTLPEQVKLYNSGSFFDPAAIPFADYSEIAQKVAGVGHLVVESHPRLIGKSALKLRELLASSSLEVAMGLEPVHPVVLPRLNKGLTLSDFAKAAGFLRRHDITVRAFVLLKPPFLSEAEGLDWAVRSARFAFATGAEVVSVIPTRAGNGALDRLREAGEFTPPLLPTLERALEALLERRQGRVFADLWDLEQFSTCAACFHQRRRRLQQMNSQQIVPPKIGCPLCGHE